MRAVDDGRKLLHYRILDRLGEGGMGVVYRAEDTRMGRMVALKLLRPDLAGDDEWNRRFEREVRAASSFSHPGIATIYDFQHEGGSAFYTMELVEGRNLREVLKKEGPLPAPALVECALQIAAALAEAHRKGVVHRDLKPENVMESASGFYKILDFGLARCVPGDLLAPGTGSSLETVPRDTTQAGRIVGTVSYMSPEQAQGAAVDARSDIFAFGSLVYELATGEPPFRRANAIATFHAIVHEDPPPLGAALPGVPGELERILARCLAKDPARRYQKASDLADDLRALRGSGASGAGRISAVSGYPGANVARSMKIWGTSSRRWATVTWVLLALVAGLVAGRLWLFPAAP
ncbi:MAG TPA: serine/threonine-protein kinase, partial [Candidatus Saccharimonadales bacterium]|nr:serine/threonine-protein kinase [Candidatus Saccharimonadales bacterium]